MDVVGVGGGGGGWWWCADAVRRRGDGCGWSGWWWALVVLLCYFCLGEGGVDVIGVGGGLWWEGGGVAWSLKWPVNSFSFFHHQIELK